MLTNLNVINLEGRWKNRTRPSDREDVKLRELKHLSQMPDRVEPISACYFLFS